ncbi:MAG: DUF6455 family protein [Maritimibacter sp.]
MRMNLERTRQTPRMIRMAQTLGLDLDVELAATTLSRRQLMRAQSRCKTCADPKGCDRWLGDHDGGSATAPAICPNKALLEHLRVGY